MRKLLIFFFIFFGCCSVMAQKKTYHIDIRAKQTFGLNQWYDDPSVSSFLRKPSSTDLQIAFFKEIYKEWGAFFDLSVALFSYDKISDPLYSFSPLNMENYYIGWQFKQNEQAKLGTKLTIGVFRKFNVGKWEIIPALGYGVDEVNAPSFSYQLKEKDTNAMYIEEYNWLNTTGTEVKMFHVISAQVQSYYRIGKCRLNLGIEFRQFLNRAKFYSTTMDSYDNTIIRNDCLKGNLMNNLSVSVGVSMP